MIAVLVIAVFVGLLVYGLFFNDTAKLRRALRGAPRQAIAAAAEGAEVRVDGTVLPGETLVAPLTGRPCVVYEAVVEEWVNRGKTGSWRQRIREVRGVPFLIDDGTGHALVDPTGARLDVKIDLTTRSGTFDAPTPIEKAFLDRHGMSGEGWLFNKKLRYREGVFAVGERVAAMGRPVREPDRDAASRVHGYRGDLPTRLRLGGSADHPILLSDDASVTR